VHRDGLHAEHWDDERSEEKADIGGPFCESEWDYAEYGE
jgi:hypothetical protein